MHKAVQTVKDLLFPPRCVFCDRVISPKERPACRACREKSIARISEDVCPACGRERAFCSCHRNHLLSDGMAAPFYYTGTVKDAVALLKRYDDADRTDYFVAQMAETAYRAFGDKVIDYVTAVPLFPADRAQRGFDQAGRLAEKLARELHVPYARLLRKVFRTPPQKTLTYEQRITNLLGVFDVTAKAPLEHTAVLLVDDVATTGSTTNECAKMLKIYGVDKVYVLTVALTKPEHDTSEPTEQES